MRRWIAAGALLLSAYTGLAALASPRGFLGTDTGGKVATLRVMDRCDCADPDVGYWAEQWDADGSLHPLWFTARVGDRWVNLSTLPMTLAARPLFEAFGYRGALVFPMLGGVAAAFAAAALARRVSRRDDDGWRAFWVVGLASPITIYALDFWEHSIGVALMAWAIVLVLDVVEDGAAWPKAAVAGALLGTSATMRTETFVYTAVIGVCALAALARSTDRRSIVSPAIAAAVAFALPLAANLALERAVLGTDLRGSRTAGTALMAGDQPYDRLEEAWFSLFGLVGSRQGVALGVVAVALLVFALNARVTRRDATFGVATVAAAAALYVVRVATSGLGFVPGMFVAWPLAARVRAGFVSAVALAPVPIVLATQYRGGAAPQWAGRYLLVSGLLLTVVALVTTEGWVRRAVTFVAVGVTLFGVAWLSVRSHDVERAIATVEGRPEPVIVSTVGHLAREGGATYGDRRWLTAVGNDAVGEAAAVVAAAGEERFVLVETNLTHPPANASSLGIDGWTRMSDPTYVRLFDGINLLLTTWRRAG